MKSKGVTIMKSLTRPRGLNLICIILVLAGLLSLLGGLIPALFALNTHTVAQGLGFLQFLAPALSTVLTVLGIFYLSLSYSLWKGYRWAWAANVAFILLHIVADIGFVASRSFALDKVIGLAIITAMLGYLLSPHVRAYFKGDTHDAPTNPAAV